MPIVCDQNRYGSDVSMISNAEIQMNRTHPIKIAILNLMPNKITTEHQLLRLLGKSPLPIEVTLLYTKTYAPTHMMDDYLQKQYRVFDDVKDDTFDAFIITGAPVEHLSFEQVDYWDELTDIFTYVHSNVRSTLFLCWASQAALHFYYDIPRFEVSEKIFGIERFKTRVKNSLTDGFESYFNVPQSRYFYHQLSDIQSHSDLILYAGSEQSGAQIVASKDYRSVFIAGHFEYDADTLHLEYKRDQERGLHTSLPTCYFVNDDPTQGYCSTWQKHAERFFTNWITHIVDPTVSDA